MLGLEWLFWAYTDHSVLGMVILCLDGQICIYPMETCSCSRETCMWPRHAFICHGETCICLGGTCLCPTKTFLRHRTTLVCMPHLRDLSAPRPPTYRRSPYLCPTPSPPLSPTPYQTSMMLQQATCCGYTVKSSGLFLNCVCAFLYSWTG